MFSMTTIASSTRMPIDSDSASMVMLLNVKPEQLHDEERADDRGRQGERADQRGPRVAEEHEDDEDGEPAPNSRSNCTSWIECSMKTELSVGTEMVTPRPSSSGR